MSIVWQGRPLVLTSVLPVLVLYLSEVVSSDVQYAVKVEEQARRKAQRRRRREVFSTDADTGSPPDVDHAQAGLAKPPVRADGYYLDEVVDSGTVVKTEAGIHVVAPNGREPKRTRRS